MLTPNRLGPPPFGGGADVLGVSCIVPNMPKALAVQEGLRIQYSSPDVFFAQRTPVVHDGVLAPLIPRSPLRTSTVHVQVLLLK
jgi:hypothetical protein